MPLIKQAAKALNIIYADGFNYHKCGMVVMDLVPEDKLQYSLYDQLETELEKKVSNTLDKLNKSFGKDIMRVASQGYSRKCKLK